MEAKAVSLAALLQEKFGVSVELIPSDGGAFEVQVNDTMVHSRKALGKFPDEDALISYIRANFS